MIKSCLAALALALCASMASGHLVTPEDVALHSQAGATALVIHDFLSPAECEALINDSKSTVTSGPLRDVGADWDPKDPHFLAQGTVDQVSASVADKLHSAGLGHVTAGPVPVRTVWGATLPHADTHPVTHPGGPRGDAVCPKGLCPTAIVYLSDATAPLVMHTGDKPVHYDTPAGTLVIMPAGVIHHQGAESPHARYILGPLSTVTAPEQLSGLSRRFLVESCIEVEDLADASYSAKSFANNHKIYDIQLAVAGSNSVAINNALELWSVCVNYPKACEMEGVRTFGDAETSLEAALEKQWCGRSIGKITRFDFADCTVAQSCFSAGGVNSGVSARPTAEGLCEGASMSLRYLNDLEKASMRGAQDTYKSNMVAEKKAQNDLLTIDCPDLVANYEAELSSANTYA